MPNFVPGTDQGTLLSHPLYDSPFNEVAGGPYKLTYNGFIRPNTGLYDGDRTGDGARNAWHYYMQNLDITVSKYDCDGEASENSVAIRDADGGLIANYFSTDNIYLGDDGLRGVVSGGAF